MDNGVYPQTWNELVEMREEIANIETRERKYSEEFITTAFAKIISDEARSAKSDSDALPLSSSRKRSARSYDLKGSSSEDENVSPVANTKGKTKAKSKSKSKAKYRS